MFTRPQRSRALSCSSMHPAARFAALAALVGVAAGVSAAGPLNPPPGPIMPTYKTLAEVEPRTPINAVTTPGDVDSVYKITQPGSYYLTGPITGEAGKSGIEIEIAAPADATVTIDLSGFEMVGVANSLAGIQLRQVQGVAPPRLSIRNGAVRGFGGTGISASHTPAAQYHNLLIAGNGSWGLYAGANSIVTDCIARDNADRGIYAGNNSHVARCIADSNGSLGITASSNSTITDCSAEQNESYGIVAYSPATIRGCVAQDNTSDGISLLPPGNSSYGGTIANCTATRNGQHGIYAAYGSVVTDCSAMYNDAHGIATGGASIIRSCVANANGSSAFHAGISAGAESRIEGNNVMRNYIGISTAGGYDSVVIANTARSNSVNNYVTAPSDLIGPVVTGSGTIASTNPWANFSQ